VIIYYDTSIFMWTMIVSHHFIHHLIVNVDVYNLWMYVDVSLIFKFQRYADIIFMTPI
jgi:hypothetical protein